MTARHDGRWWLSALLLGGVTLAGCDGLRAFVMRHYPQNYTPVVVGTPAVASAQAWPPGIPSFTEGDENRTQISVALTPLVDGLNQPTDIQFPPGQSHHAVVLEKEGRALRVDLQTGAKQTILEMDVLTKSEQGLLGWAFHPAFVESGRVFLHASVDRNGTPVGRIEEWRVDPVSWKATRIRTILELEQPYGNHDAGQIAFGPDGRLYIGFGDGGWRDDPHDNGQNGRTWLGSMLRIDVETGHRDGPYTVPDANPWVGKDGFAPEAWAIGLRNPWRFSFAPDGRMIVADVGQNAFEEIDLVVAGDNLGWNRREGRHCFPQKSDCSVGTLVEPIYEYGRNEGKSITGGYVYTGRRIPALAGQYVFADFVSGRIWAIPLPEDRTGPMVEASALGQWPMLPSTFGRAADGELYIADFGKGVVYRLDPI